MSKTNKIICYVVACMLILCVAVLMFGCKKGETGAETKVMNMSINPEVEFILDKDNKVVSVSAKNDEGNFIVAKATFEGLTAEEAAKLFVQLTNENGFVVDAGDLKIEISGEDAQKIFNSVKDNINVYLGEEGININITLDKIDREALEAELKDCMKELADDEIAKLTEDEIIAKVKDMRDQTKGLNTEKLKEMYYEFRAQAIEEAKFKAYFDALGDFSAAIKTQYDAFISELNDMKTKFVNNFMDESSAYQKAMQEFIEAKQELLQARLDEANKSVLEAKEAAVAAAQTALDAAENAAQKIVDTFNSGLSMARTALETAIEAIVNNLPANINATINTKVGEVEASFEAKFKEDYIAHIDANYWNGLAPTPNAAA